MDYDGNLPAYVLVSDGKTPENKGAYDIPLLKNSVIVADRFYNDFSLLNVWDSSGVWFVVRHKENLQYTSIQENEHPDGVMSMCSKMSASSYPGPSPARNIRASFAEWPYGMIKTSR